MMTAFEVCSASLNQSRFGSDPQLVLTLLPLCYFMISIPVEKNLLIGLSRCIIVIFWMPLLPHEGSRDGERLLHENDSVGNLRRSGQKTCFYFLCDLPLYLLLRSEYGG